MLTYKLKKPTSNFPSETTSFTRCCQFT